MRVVNWIENLWRIYPSLHPRFVQRRRHWACSRCRPTPLGQIYPTQFAEQVPQKPTTGGSVNDVVAYQKPTILQNVLGRKHVVVGGVQRPQTNRIHIHVPAALTDQHPVAEEIRDADDARPVLGINFPYVASVLDNRAFGYALDILVGVQMELMAVRLVRPDAQLLHGGEARPEPYALNDHAHFTRIPSPKSLM